MAGEYRKRILIVCSADFEAKPNDVAMEIQLYKLQQDMQENFRARQYFYDYTRLPIRKDCWFVHCYLM